MFPSQKKLLWVMFIVFNLYHMEVEDLIPVLWVAG
jgi:hypothetical protein